MKRRRWRKRFKLLAGLACLVGLGVALLPFWFPWVLQPALSSLGIQTQGLQRRGYAELHVAALRYEDAKVSVLVTNLSIPQPTALLWYRWRGPQHSKAGIQAERWHVEIKPVESSSPQTNAPADVTGTLDEVLRYVKLARAWLPPARLNNGLLRIGDHAVLVPTLAWDGQHIRTSAAETKLGLDTELSLATPSSRRGALRLRLEQHAHALGLEVTLRPGAEGWKLDGQGHWLTNQFTLRASYPREGTNWWPGAYALTAPSLRVPGAQLGLPLYQAVTGAVHIEGESDRVQFAVEAHAPASEPWPALEVTVAGALDARRVQIERLAARSPWGTVSLSNRLDWSWSTRQLAGPCQLVLDLDLGTQPWVPATGKVQGAVSLATTDSLRPLANFRLHSRELEIRDVKLAEAELAGELEDTTFKSVRLQATAADGSRFEAQAQELDLAQRRVRGGHLAAHLRPTVWPDLDRAVVFDESSLTVDLAGTWPALVHTGRVQVTALKVPGLKPAQANVDWRGEGLRLIEPRVQWLADGARLLLAGRMTDISRIELEEFEVQAADNPPLGLEGTARFSLASSNSNAPAPLSLSVEHLSLTNAHRLVALEARVAYPTMARGEVRIEGVNSALVNAFLERPLPEASIHTLRASFGWDKGPLSLDFAWQGTAKVPPDLTLRLAGNCTTDAQGIRIEKLTIHEADQRALELTGSVPVTLTLVEGMHAQPLKGRPLEIHTALGPTPALQQWLATQAGLALQGAEGQLDVTGTLESPTAALRLRLNRLQATAGSKLTNILPRVERGELELLAQPDRLILSRLGFRLEDQPVELSGVLPLKTVLRLVPFQELSTQGPPQPDWQHAQVRLQVPGFELAALSERLGKVLRPEGTLRADVRFDPETGWAGNIALTNAGTRPLPSLGPLRQIHGRIALEKRSAVIEKLELDVGGAQAKMGGTIGLPIPGQGELAWPEFDVSLEGTELPLAREAGLIVRGDLALRLVHTSTNAPLIEGQITLRRSFLLRDLQDLFRGSVRTASRPPPYFSIEQEPFAGWRLDLDIVGDRFLHIKSPFYRGVHSVNLHLKGTLKEPVLTGDAQVAQGSLVFPYAAIPVRQGLITFSEDNPTEPRLVVMGRGRTFGYDVRVEIQGTLSEPSIQFSSTPPLTSEEILLMITAGELPRNELTYTARDRLTKLAFLIGKDLMNRFGAQDATEERLIVRSGESISTRGKVTHSIEYRLTDSWSIVGEYDEYDAINGGVKWRILRR